MRGYINVHTWEGNREKFNEWVEVHKPEYCVMYFSQFFSSRMTEFIMKMALHPYLDRIVSGHGEGKWLFGFSNETNRKSFFRQMTSSCTAKLTEMVNKRYRPHQPPIPHVIGAIGVVGPTGVPGSLGPRGIPLLI